MAGSMSRKRKVPSKEAIANEPTSDDDFEAGLLNGALSLSEDDDTTEEEGSEDEEDEPDQEDEEELDSDEIPSSDDEENIGKNGRKIELDSAGNPRYIYPEIDPVYDSDDSDREEANTIGNIPLSLYDEYPHVGYSINGKRIMRPAKGQALDALLESIDLPEGWTGMIDKNTGEGLKLTGDELEILRKIQMQEIPEEGYDPYAVSREFGPRYTIC